MSADSRYANTLFFQLCEAVKTGGRPPIHKGAMQAAYGALAQAGKIKIEISGHNWRRVTILWGEHAGRKTPPNPHGHKVYLVCDELGYRRLCGAEQYADIS